MFQEERLYKILELLHEKQRLTTNDIVAAFGVSRDTARRDIVKLADEGSVLRTHGGITIPKESRTTKVYNLRVKDNPEAKMRIGKKAAGLISPGQVCYFDSSTTVLQLCKFADTSIEAFSNSLDNVQILDRRKCNVHIIGGKLNHDHQYIYGYEAIEQIRSIHYDIAFLGTDGITEEGFYSYIQDEAMIKKIVAEVSDKVYVLADITKFNQKRPYKYFPISSVDAVVVDSNPGDEQINIIESYGTKIIIAE